MPVDSLSIVIPAYRSESSLPVLAARLATLLPSLATHYEVIIVNDGSPDATGAVLDAQAQLYPWLRPVHLMRNFGQHNALLCGIRQARYAITVTMDDDLQNPPEEIPRLLAKLREGYDAVYGFPHQESHGLLRDLASRMTKIALQAGMGVDTARHVSSFRAFRTQIRDAFADYRGSFVSIDVLLTWGAGRFSAIPVANPPRELGVSNYTVRKLIVHALNMITGFTVLPLQIASLLGFGFSSFGFLLLVYVIGRYFWEGGSIPGFPFLASIISIFSGVTLFSLGIIGEYIARMHFRLLDRPSYAVRKPEQGSP